VKIIPAKPVAPWGRGNQESAQEERATAREESFGGTKPYNSQALATGTDVSAKK